jgi:hypothetical protein
MVYFLLYGLKICMLVCKFVIARFSMVDARMIIDVLLLTTMDLCCKTRQKFASSRETREFFKKTSFWRVFGEKLGRVFGEFLGKTREFLEKLGKNSRVDGKNSPILNFITGRGF